MERIPGPPSIQPLEGRKLKAVVLENAEAVRGAARDAAESRMTKGQQELRGLSLKKRIWDYGLARRVNLNRETANAEQKIRGSKNIFAAEGLGIDAHKHAQEALIERFTSAYEETVHTEAGEKRHDEEAERQYAPRIKELILQFGRGEIDEENFIEEKNRTIAQAFGWKDSDKARTAVYHADNLLEIAKEVRLAASHHEGMEALAAELEITIGRAKSGIRTEAHFDVHDRLVEKLQSTRLGALVPEAKLSAIVAVVGAATERVVRSRATAWGTLGASALVGGAVVGTKENARLKAERKRYAREIAQGKEVTTSPDKEKAEQYRYQTESAATLISRLNLEGLDLTQENNWRVLRQALVEVESRIQLSDREKIDLIAYSDISVVEKERLDLDIARAKAKIALRDTERAVFGTRASNFGSILHFATSERRNEFTDGEKKEKDDLFNKMKAKRVGVAVGTGTLVGLGVGVVAQEVLAGVSGQQGLIFNTHNKTLPDQPTARTVLHRLLVTKETSVPTTPLPPTEVYTLPDNKGKVKLPVNIELIQDKTKAATDPHAWHLLYKKDGSTVPLKEFATDGKGHLTSGSLKALEDHGIKYHTDVINEKGNPKVEITHHVPDTEYIKQHLDPKKSDSFHAIRRQFWYDQNSPYKSIGNALRLQWGGLKGTGMDREGNYVFNVLNMSQGGSFHGKNALDVQKAIASGQLKMLLSMTCETQTFVVEVPINPDGNAVIDPNSSIGKIFFGKDAQGHAVFKGQYAEVGQQLGSRGEDGRENFRILATHGGTRDMSIPDSLRELPTIKQVPVTSFEFPPPPDVSDNSYVAPPPIIPIYSPLPTRQGEKDSEKSFEDELYRTMGRERMSPEDAELLAAVVGTLMFKEVKLSKAERKLAMGWIGESDQAPKYVQSLLELAKTHGLEEVEHRAKNLSKQLFEIGAKIGVPISAHGRSLSWVMWEMGKESYFYSHPAEADTPHFDPMGPVESREQIVNRMLGWEAYQAYRSRKGSAWKRKVDADPRYEAARKMLEKIPFRNQTLSLEQRIQLGALLRTISQSRAVTR